MYPDDKDLVDGPSTMKEFLTDEEEEVMDDEVDWDLLTEAMEKHLEDEDEEDEDDAFSQDESDDLALLEKFGY